MGNILSTSIWPDMAISLHSLLLLEEQQCHGGRGRKRKRRSNRKHNRGFILHEIDHLTELEFRKMFRMRRNSFEKLYRTLEPLLYTPNAAMARRSSGSIISKKNKLYCTLRWLAGGSYLDIYIAYGVSRSSFFSTSYKSGIVWPVIDAINIAFQIGLPRDRDELRKLANGFSRFTSGELFGCVSAIDGWVCKTRKPHQSEVGDVMAYHNRHGCWGLVVLAGCDADCRYNIFSCMYSGSTNDCLAWDICAASKIVEHDDWPMEFYVIGDEAFVCTNNFLTPYSGCGLGPWTDAFDFYLSSMCQCIERSFALLVQHWGILWHPFQIEFSGWTKVLMVLAKLHNFCIDEGDVPLRERYHADILDGDEFDVIMNDDVIDEEELCYIRSHRSGDCRRNCFRVILEEKGLRRPQYNINCRA